MRAIVTLLFLLALSFAAGEDVVITSDRFEADESSRVTRFLGHVWMKKGSDELNATKVTVYFDDKRKPKRYEAVGKVSFVIHMKENGQWYTGKSERLVYRPKGQVYELYGHVVLKEPARDRTVTGEKVIVEKLSGKALVEGQGDRPVKFIFRVEENNAS